MDLDFLDNGVVTEPMTKDTPIYNFGELLSYCKKNGKTPAELTDKERDRFRIYPPSQ